VDHAGATLRPARPDDVEFLFHVFVHSRASALALLASDDPAHDALLRMQFSAQDRAYRTQFPDARFDVIECGGTPIGRLAVDRREHAIHVVDVALLPEHRGRGIATSLLRALLAEAAANGQAVTLRVDRDSPALSLYRRLGFATVSEDAVYAAMAWRQPKIAS
jgi:ribosomal protein S18 acetylase RimI-like enzyme